MSTVSRFGNQAQQVNVGSGTNFIGGLNTNPNLYEPRPQQVSEIMNFDITSAGSLSPRYGINVERDLSDWIDFDGIIEYKSISSTFSYDTIMNAYSEETLISNISTPANYTLKNSSNNFDILYTTFEGEVFPLSDLEGKYYLEAPNGKKTTIKLGDSNGDYINITELTGTINSILGVKYIQTLEDRKNYVGDGINEMVIYHKNDETFLISRLGNKINEEWNYYKPSPAYKILDGILNFSDYFIETYAGKFFLNLENKIMTNRIIQKQDNIENEFIDYTDGNEIYAKTPTLNQISVHGFNVLDPNGDIDVEDSEGTVVNVNGIQVTGVDIDNKIQPFRTEEEVKLLAIMSYTNTTPLSDMRYKWSYTFFGQSYNTSNENALYQGDMLITNGYSQDNKDTFFVPTTPGYYRFYINMLLINDLTNNIKVDTSAVTWGTDGTYTIYFSIKDGYGNEQRISANLILHADVDQTPVVKTNPFTPSDVLQITADATFTYNNKSMPNTKRLVEDYNAFATGLEGEEDARFKTNQRSIVDIEFTNEVKEQEDTLLMYESLKKGKHVIAWNNYMIYVGAKDTPFSGYIFFSLPENPCYVPTSFYLKVSDDDIVDFCIYREDLFIFTNHNVYKLNGDVPLSIKNAITNKSSVAEFTVNESLSNIGLAYEKNVSSIADGMIVYSSDGIRKIWYTTNGSGNTLNSKVISNSIYSILPDKFYNFIFLKDRLYMFSEKIIYIYQGLDYNQTTGDGRFLLYNFKDEDVDRKSVSGFLKSNLVHLVFEDGIVEQEDSKHKGIDNGINITCFAKTQINYINIKESIKHIRNVIMVAVPICTDVNGIEKFSDVSLDVWCDGKNIINSNKYVLDEEGNTVVIQQKNFGVFQQKFALDTEEKDIEIIRKSSPLGKRYSTDNSFIYEEDNDLEHIGDIPLIGAKKVRGIQVKVTITEPILIKDFGYGYKIKETKGDNLTLWKK